MPVEERRRVALHRALSSVITEEATDTLFDLLTPSGHELATRQDVADLRAEMERGFERIDARFSPWEHRWDAFEDRIDRRFAEMDVRFAEMDVRLAEMNGRLAEMNGRFGEQDGRFHELGERFERRISDAVTTQTRTLVLSQLAALVVIAGLAFGLQ